MKAVRYAGAAVCLALAAYFMAPLVMGILHIGMVYPAALLASVWARRCGLEAESLGCASWWPLGPGYWAREAVAVVVLEVGSLLQGG